MVNSSVKPENLRSHLSVEERPSLASMIGYDEGDYVVEFYNDKIWQLILSLPEGIRSKMIDLLKIMQIKGNNLSGKFTKKLTEDLFELRIKAKEGYGRAFYCTIKGRKIIVVHSIVKKCGKTPSKDLNLAKVRTKEVRNASI